MKAHDAWIIFKDKNGHEICDWYRDSFDDATEEFSALDGPGNTDLPEGTSIIILQECIDGHCEVDRFIDFNRWEEQQ